MKSTVLVPTLVLALLAACKSYTAPSNTPTPTHTTYSAVGDSAAVAAKLVEFRAALGGGLNAPNSPPADSGRREINWDGVPAAVTNIDAFPVDFFNVNSKRGAIMSTTGTGLRVDSTDFANGTAALADQFHAFSPKKLFMAVGSNQVTVRFQLSGAATPALVKGFGSIFSDVDKAGSTRIDFFDANDLRIATITAPAQAGAHGFAFVGATFASAIVARVVITSGEAALDGTSKDVTAGGTKDLVVMDDFIYGEPLPVQP